MRILFVYTTAVILRNTMLYFEVVCKHLTGIIPAKRYALRNARRSKSDDILTIRLVLASRRDPFGQD